jgi:RNA polymerase sigma-70 factor (ECF subfamily)
MTRIGESELRELQRQHGPALLSFFARRVAPPQDAAILLNELLTVVWRRTTSAPTDPEELRMWMFGIARKLVLSRGRTIARQDAVVERLRTELSLGSSAPTTDVLAVRQAVADLPAKQAELVRLIHWDGFTIVQAANLTGTSASTARSRYQLARQRLARELSTRVEDPEPAFSGSRS